MVDLHIKCIITRQFIPNDTELILPDRLSIITPRINEYFRKKLSKVFSDGARRGIFAEDNTLLSYLSDDLMESSARIAQLWKEEFVIPGNQKTNGLVFIQFDKDDVEHSVFLRITLEENFAHTSSGSGSPIKIAQNNLPLAVQTLDEALVISRSSHHYYLIEERIKHSGSFTNCSLEDLLQVQPEQSAKESIKMAEQAAQKIAENFQQDNFAFQSKMKAAIHKGLEEEQELSPEKSVSQLLDSNLTTHLTFVDGLKEGVPEPIQVADIDHSRQTKRLENQKLSLPNGIQLIIPNNVYDDAESVELIRNPNGTYPILIKNIENIQNE